MAQEELKRAKVVGVLRLGPKGSSGILVGGQLAPDSVISPRVQVVTRSELDTFLEPEEGEEGEQDPPEPDSKPLDKVHCEKKKNVGSRYG